MAGSFTGTCIPSSTRPWSLQFSLAGLALAQGWWLATGTSVGAPATYGGLSDAGLLNPDQFTTYTSSYGPAGFSASGTVLIDAYSPTHPDLWLAIFNSYPGGSDVPIMVAGPFAFQTY